MTDLPEPRDPALFLALSQQQLTVPHQGALAPLPPTRSLAGWLWTHAGRIAPLLTTSASWALARAWHEGLPAGSTQPLWLMGGVSVIAAAAGIISAAKLHGSETLTATAFAAAGTAVMTGMTAWTTELPLSLLLWLISTAGIYALCANQWRQDRRMAREQQHAVTLAHVQGFNGWRETAIRTAGMVEVAHSAERAERVRVDGIIAASTARTPEADALVAREARSLEPGQELDVEALLKAAGQAPLELSAVERKMGS